MKYSKKWFLIAVFLLAVIFNVQSQSDLRESYTSEDINGLKEQILSDPGITDDLQEVILEVHNSSLAALSITKTNRESIENSNRKRADIERIVTILQAEIDSPLNVIHENNLEDLSLETAEDRLVLERSRLEAHAGRLREVERLSEDRAKERLEISRRLAVLEVEAESLNDGISEVDSNSAHPDLIRSMEIFATIRREQISTEAEMLRVRLDYLADWSSVASLRVDIAKRDVEISAQIVPRVEEITRELRARESAESLNEIKEMATQLSEESPHFEALTQEIEDLAELLWGNEGIVPSLEQSTRDLAETRRYQSELERIKELTYRKYAAYGGHGSIRRWWPEFPADFIQLDEVEQKLELLSLDIPEIEHKIILVEQDRAGANGFGDSVISDLKLQMGEEFGPEEERQIRSILSIRRDLLDDLIKIGSRYSNQVAEYQTASEIFMKDLRELEAFLDSNLIWYRSVPKPLIPPPADSLEAARWLKLELRFRDIDPSQGNLFVTLMLLVCSIGLFVLRPSLKRQLLSTATDSEEASVLSINPALKALAFTLLLLIPLPLILFTSRVFLASAGTTPFWNAVSRAFGIVALASLLLESFRWIFIHRGLAEAYFGWFRRPLRPMSPGMIIARLFEIPLLLLALILVFAGGRLDSPQNTLVYNNSLGRLAFIVALTLIGVMSLLYLKPGRSDGDFRNKFRIQWPRNFSAFTFPFCIILATFLPVVLSLSGYYITGMLLAYQMMKSLLLLIVVAIAAGLFSHDRDIRSKRYAEGADETFNTGDKQVRQLFRFVIKVAAITGFLVIWSNALPLLQILKRIQVLPVIELLEETAPEQSISLPQEISTDELGIPNPVALEPIGRDLAPGLTLWNLLKAIIVGSLTIALVRNLPGVVGILLKRQSGDDIGGQFAIVTLFRYIISIIGMTVFFGILGVDWSKIQWLAAALTFGLGFGLQEIVANFVSGLIILVERPVRVGDVVTIGDNMGSVTRIQIRATTITLWDKSEMVVPNKEFVTTKLINWTLSDSRRRIDIPVRIAFGADLELVRRLLMESAVSHPHIQEEPGPQVLLISFGEDAIRFELRFYVDFLHGLTTRDEVQVAIQKAFGDNGVEFAVPKVEIDLGEHQS